MAKTLTSTSLNCSEKPSFYKVHWAHNTIEL